MMDRGRGRTRSVSRGSRSSGGSTGSRSSCTTVARTNLPQGQLEDIQNVKPKNNVNVMLNAFRFDFKVVKRVYHYNLAFFILRGSKENDNTRKIPITLTGRDYQVYRKNHILNELFKLLLEMHPEIFIKRDNFYIYDRIVNLFTSCRMNDRKFEIPANFISNVSSAYFGKSGVVCAELTFCREVDPLRTDPETRISDFYIETALAQDEYERPDKFIRNNSCYDLKSKTELNAYSLNDGHVKSVTRSGDIGLVVVDPKKSLFYKPIPVIKFLKAKFNFNDGSNLCHEPLRSQFSDELKNLYVETTHRQHYFPVSGVSSESANEIVISDLNCTVAEYFHRKGTTLEYPHYPCIIERKKVPGVSREFTLNYIPMELLTIAAAQRVSRAKIIEDVESDYIRACQALPAKKIPDIKKEARNVSLFDQHILKQSNIKCDEKLYEAKARQLYQPNVLFRDTSKEPETFSWDFLRTDKFVRGARIQRMIVLTLNASINSVRDFMKRYVDDCRSAGLHIANYNVEEIRNLPNEDLTELFKQWKANGIDFVFTIGDDKNFHNNLKSAELNSIVVTQQVLYRTIKDYKMNTISNIMKKMNLKAGGINYELGTTQAQIRSIGREINLHETLLQDTMVIGFFATQGRIVSNGTYCCGYGATTTKSGNVTTGGYFYCKSAKPPLEPTQLGIACKDVVTKYCQANQSFPKRIIIYRGGMNLAKDNDYENELRHFGTALRQLLPQYREAKMPSVTYIVSSRRHNLRLLKKENEIEPEARATQQNVQPGTCLDGISARKDEFIVLSHKCLIGTAKPYYCKVLFQKGVPLELSIIEQITYNLCYMHEICDSPIAEPSPLRCAQELGERGMNNYINGNGNSSSDPSSSQSSGTVEQHFARLTDTYANPLKGLAKRYWA